MLEIFKFQCIRRHTSHGVTYKYTLDLPIFLAAASCQTQVFHHPLSEGFSWFRDNHPLGFQLGNWTTQPHALKPCFTISQRQYHHWYRLFFVDSWAGTALGNRLFINPPVRKNKKKKSLIHFNAYIYQTHVHLFIYSGSHLWLQLWQTCFWRRNLQQKSSDWAARVPPFWTVAETPLAPPISAWREVM